MSHFPVYVYLSLVLQTVMFAIIGLLGNRLQQAMAKLANLARVIKAVENYAALLDYFDKSGAWSPADLGDAAAQRAAAWKELRESVKEYQGAKQ